LSCALSLDYSVPHMDLSPSGFALDANHDAVSEPVVTVATDLPVHKNRHMTSLNEGGSPFLLLVNEMGGPSFHAWKQKLDVLQQLRETRFSDLRQLIDFARAGNWDMVGNCLETMFDEEPSDETLATIRMCYRVMAVMYVPLISQSVQFEILKEYYGFLNDCTNTKATQYKSLLEEWRTMPLYRGFRTKALSAFLRVLEHFDAFTVGLLFEEMPQALQGQIDDYRIFRDDYAVVKVMYQDLFELTSQLLIFLGAIVNLSKRGAPWHYASGDCSRKAFSKKTAFERFKMLSELPKLSGLLGRMSRPMRNSIGHFSADYEPCTGNLRYDDGSQLNYIVFLHEFLAAVRSLSFILTVVEKADIDMSRLGVTIPVS